MSTTRTSVLAAVFVLLAGYFFIFEGVSVERPLPEWERAEKILRCGAEQPARLRVSAKGRVIAAERSAAGWQVEPAAPAERAFEDLAGALCTLPIIDRIPEPGKLEEFGIDADGIQIEVEITGGRRVLALGSYSPAGNFVYGKWQDGPEVLKLGALLRSEVDKVLHHLARSDVAEPDLADAALAVEPAP